MTSARLSIEGRATFEINFVADGSHDLPAVNFFDEGGANTLLHVVARFAANSIVMNLLIGGHWGEEIAFPHRWHADPELRLQVTMRGSNITVRTGSWEYSALNLPRPLAVADIKSIGLYGPVSVRRIGGVFHGDQGDTGLLWGHDLPAAADTGEAAAENLPAAAPVADLAAAGRQPIDPALGTLLFAGISSTKAGSLVDLVTWFARHTFYRLQVVMLEAGNRDRELAESADSLVLAEWGELASDRFTHFVASDVVFCLIDILAAVPMRAMAVMAAGLAAVPVVYRVIETPDWLEEFAGEFGKAAMFVTESHRVKTELVAAFGIGVERICVLEDFLRRDERLLALFVQLRRQLKLRPMVSVLVPTYNQQPYIMQRLESIAAQSFADFEIILLDDFSTDRTLATVYENFFDPRLSIVTNQENSGSPFAQWRRGLTLATAPYIWIAEGDDFCTPNLLEVLVPLIAKPGFVIAHAKTEITDAAGLVQEGALDAYLQRAHPTKYDADYQRDGASEVEESFAHLSSVVNASGVLIRASAIDFDELEAAAKFKLCGDWLVYLSLLRTGAIAYSRQARNFFRRHPQSAVHQFEGTPTFYRERFEIARYVVRNFSISKRALGRIFAEIDNDWQYFAARNRGRNLAEFFDKPQILAQWRAGAPPRHLRIGLFCLGDAASMAAQLTSVWLRRGHQMDFFCCVEAAQAADHPFDPKFRLFAGLGEADLAHAGPQLRSTLANQPPDVFVLMLPARSWQPVFDAAFGLGFPIVVSELAQAAKPKHGKDRDRILARADGIHLLQPRRLAAPLLARTRVIAEDAGSTFEETALAWERWLSLVVEESGGMEVWERHLKGSEAMFFL